MRVLFSGYIPGEKIMHQFPMPTSALVATLLAFSLISCSAKQYGFSGMADIDEHSFLVVHDTLSFEDGPRISVVHTSNDKGIEIVPVDIGNWDHADGRSSDLESACALSGRPNEFLLVEAGHWNHRYGRLFHVKIDLSGKPHPAAVLHAYEVEETAFKGNVGDKIDADGDDFEGVACIPINHDKYLLLLGERGGSQTYPTGVIRWITIDLSSTKNPAWTSAGKKGIKIVAPGRWTDPTGNRDISALHLDDCQILWAAASEEIELAQGESSDAGPFYSVIYRIGKVDVHGDKPIRDFCAEEEQKTAQSPDYEPKYHCSAARQSSPYEVRHTISGFKVEALAARAEDPFDRKEFSIGTEDENLVGAWRPVRKPPAAPGSIPKPCDSISPGRIQSE